VGKTVAVISLSDHVAKFPAARWLNVHTNKHRYRTIWAYQRLNRERSLLLDSLHFCSLSARVQRSTCSTEWGVSTSLE
jgi:hypothetical protein